MRPPFIFRVNMTVKGIFGIGISQGNRHILAHEPRFFLNGHGSHLSKFGVGEYLKFIHAFFTAFCPRAKPSLNTTAINLKVS